MHYFWWGFAVGVFLAMFSFLIGSAACERAPDYVTRMGRDGWISKASASGWHDKRPLQCRLY